VRSGISPASERAIKDKSFIDSAMIEDIAAGAAFLGAGGGGDPYIGGLLCREALDRYGPVELLPLSALDDDAAVFMAAGFGAPTVDLEKLLSLEPYDSAVRALERRVGRTATAIIAAEIGGENATAPIAYAAMRGLPVVDADGMGRAFPSMQMSTFSLSGISCAPVALADEFGNTVVIESESAEVAEKLARPVVTAMGASAAISCYPMTGAQAKSAGIPGTISAARIIGQAITRKAASNQASVERLIGALESIPLYGRARQMFHGKIVALSRDTTGGFVFGQCEIESPDRLSHAVVKFQNENLIVEIEGAVAVIVPDLITIVDFDIARAIPTEALRYGQRVAVIACRAPPQLSTPAALAIMGPAAFGLPHPYRRFGMGEKSF
jgi:uncharacterized protein